jgi:hypothetical protein
MEEAQRGIPKALFCATVLGSAPWSPQQFLPWVLGHSAGQTRARARGGCAHGGTPSHGLRWLGRHDAAAVSAQTPQDARYGRTSTCGAALGQSGRHGEIGGKPMTRLTKGWFTVLLVSVVLTNGGCLLGLPLGGGALVGPGRGSGFETQMLYTPTLKLPESPKTIEAKAQLEPFASKIPPPDADSKRGDREVTSAGSMEGDLAELIRHAILTDFRVNSVFRSVRIYEDQPDLLIRGVIYQFAEHRSQPWYAHVPLVRVLLGPRDKVEGGVHPELMLSTSTGHLVGTYQGRSMFPDANQSGTEKERGLRPPGVQLNRAFTEAVRQIREQMLADRELMSDLLAVGRAGDGQGNVVSRVPLEKDWLWGEKGRAGRSRCTHADPDLQ